MDTYTNQRLTVDLSQFPNLVVIYLGMRAASPKGFLTLLGFGPKIQQSVKDKPEGLLLHEDMLYSLFPLHVGMRQYWRDFDSLERWSRSWPHQQWWKNFSKDQGGAELWHEAYFIQGGMEGLTTRFNKPYGLWSFAPHLQARKGMYSSRQRLKIQGRDTVPAPISEAEYYPVEH